MTKASLSKKLRMQAGQRILILNAPQGYVGQLGELPEGVELASEPGGAFDFVHVFVKDSGELEKHAPVAVKALKFDGLLWVSYPKKSSKVETDLSRDVVWELMSSTGLRPVTQVWSALRFRPVEQVGKKSGWRAPNPITPAYLRLGLEGHGTLGV